MIGDLLSQSRARAGLSCRQLAARAGVTGSTVARIERGEMEPTVAMLDRLTAAAGSVLVVTEVPTLAGLAERITEPDIDWTAIRLFTDWVHRHWWHTSIAVATRPAQVSDRLDAVFAAIAEKLCDDADVRRPGWTNQVPALVDPWEHPGTPMMRDRSRERAPQQFTARNIWLDGLWRNR
jgi:transcriptional regulator with XRE-family HTH domain